jgi:hypothetical protein
MKTFRSATADLMALALGLGVLATSGAWAQSNSANVVLTRSISGNLEANAKLQVTVTINRNLSESILALTLRETLPPGFLFKSVDSATGGRIPDIKPAVDSGGALEFAWIVTPSFPFSMTYSIQAPNVAEEEVNLSGQVEYRVNGAAQFSAITTTTISVPPAMPRNPAEVVVSRTVSGAYEANALLEVTLNVTKNDIAVNEVALKETLPEGWTFVGMVSRPGTTTPHNQPAAGSEGEITFNWDLAPEFPLSIAYLVRVGNDASIRVVLLGAMEYRTTGQVERSNIADTFLEPSKMGYCGCAPSRGTAGGGNLLVAGVVFGFLFAGCRRLDARS